MEQRTETMPRPGIAERAWRRITPRGEPSQPPMEGHLTVIEAEAPRLKLELGELWRAKDLAFTFAWRDVKVRYKQSLIGITWAILQPLATMVVFTLIFGKFAKFPAQGQHYQVFVYSGLLPWMLFATALTQISGSVLSNRQLVQKVYFPRLILPISGVLVPVIDFCFSSVVLAGIMVWYHIGVGWHVLLVPVFLLILIFTALGVGSIFATVNVRYRDVPYVIPFLVQIWLYLSPVIYPSNAIPQKWQVVFSLNPIVTAITGFRWALLGTPAPTNMEITLGLVSLSVMVVVGFRVYRWGESRFADAM